MGNFVFLNQLYKMRTLNLDTLNMGLPGITKAMGAFFAEAAIVCLVKNGHRDGAVLKVTGDFEEKFILRWSSDLDDKAHENWKNEQRASEYGAVALALLLMLHLTSYDEFEDSGIGTGIDFWLKEKNRKKLTILNPRKARLEISGIMKESPSNTIQARIRVKEEQVKSSDFTNLPAYIAVVEFGTPKSKIVKK